MSNIFWYAGLAVICFIIAVYGIHKGSKTYRVSTLIVFYLFSATLSWLGEFIVLGAFNSYAYKPDLVQDPWAQNLFAHLMLNTTMFPAAAIISLVYSLRYIGLSVIAILFMVVEYIFIQLGIYCQHWWRYYMSGINVIAFILIARYWFYRMNRHPFGTTRAITYYFIAFILIHTPSPILLLLGKQHYHIDVINNLVGNFYRTSIIIAFTYHLVAAFVFTYCACILKKWYWKVVPFAFSITAYSILAKLNIVDIDDGWKFVYTLIIQQVCILTFLLIEKYTWKPS